MRAPDEYAMATQARPCCRFCGSAGERLYVGLEDQLFGAPGRWDLARCTNPACGALWLDPQPLERDIHKAYGVYYTHTTASAPTGRLFSAALRVLVGLVLLLTGGYRERARSASMHLDGRPPGRLLEIGCGDGTFLHRMKCAGWSVEGVETDPGAAQAARQKYGLAVRSGNLAQQCFPAGEFDAVTLQHVIEHVYDPEELLREAHRILKPGGVLVVVTPNAQSWGHRRFGAHWRGLEPPRHIHVFTPAALTSTARKAGFAQISTRTTTVNAWIILAATLASKRQTKGGEGGGRHSVLARVVDISMALLLHILATVANRRARDVGEECVLIGHKRNGPA